MIISSLFAFWFSPPGAPPPDYISVLVMGLRTPAVGLLCLRSVLYSCHWIYKRRHWACRSYTSGIVVQLAKTSNV